MMWFNNGWTGFGAFGMVFMIIFWILVIALIIAIIRAAVQPNYREDRYYKKETGEDPVEILKQRYAKGEITKEQFEDMKKTIKS